MKHTAVEWLMQKWYSDEFIGEQDFNQAKAMEKEQLYNFYMQGVVDVIMEADTVAEQHYNETFKSE